MNTHADILPLIARSGLSEEELLGFIEDDLSVERSAEVLQRLGDHPELSAAVFAMRHDRGELSQELELEAAQPDASFVESTVHQGVTGEIDPAFAARLEASGGGSIARMRRPRVVRRRVFRFPSGAVGVLLAACVATAFAAALWVSWPSTPAPTRAPLAAGPESEQPMASTLAEAEAPMPELPAAVPAESRALASREAAWGGTTMLSTPAEALAAAEQGRLVIRLFSPDAAAGRELVESITMSASVSRVAMLEGRIDDLAAERIAGAVPVPAGPVFAGSPGGVDDAADPMPDRASWVYMLEVEPTERGLSLLLAGLSREPGMLVELLRSDQPITTPGSASDVSWFRKPSRDWTRRIAAPVVVQSNGR